MKVECIHYERIEKEGDRFKGKCIKCGLERTYPSIGEMEDKIERLKGRSWKKGEL